MIVAYYHPHNEGAEAGIITGPGFSTGSRLVDTYEVDASIGSFATEEEARRWLTEVAESEPVVSGLTETEGGFFYSTHDEEG